MFPLKTHRSNDFISCCFLTYRKMFGCNGQHSGVSTRVAGGTTRLEIPGSQVTVLLLEGCCSLCVSGKAFLLALSGLWNEFLCDGEGVFYFFGFNFLI